MAKGRTEQAMQNIIYSVAGQAISLLVSFILRWVFIRYLIQDYLGLDSVLTNVVAMFSLAELGVGAAINYSLYDPLAKMDHEKIFMLMKFYKTIYQFIGIAILIIGLLITPLAPYIVGKSIIPQKSICVYFALFVITTGISYFYSYKRTLLIADQYRYIALVYRYLFFVLMSVGQLLILIFTKNYTLFLVIKLIFTYLENYFVSKRVDSMYPFLKETINRKLTKNEKTEIWKNSFAMSLHKIGGTVLNSTDSLVMTHFVGLAITGIYSNYILITSAITIFVNQFFTSLVASIGNLAAESENKHKLIVVFNKTYLLGTWVSLFCSAFLYILINPFLSLWIGTNMTLNQSTVFLITLNFYLIQVRRTCLTFRDALGLYWYDRYKPIIESVLNLGLSIMLAKIIGINGVLLGTAISMILTSVWVEPYILFRRGLGIGLKTYFLKLLVWSTLGISGYVFLGKIFSDILLLDNTIFGILIRGILTLILYGLFSCFVFHFDASFKEIILLIRTFFNKIIRFKKIENNVEK
ncbi:MAG: hypothetical protein LKJ03_03280 [Enterococcaceae bacterium]|jgi:O-antigen/teichoic acid export membrane protein|nr:hypothetical protein [Enterococcaceae bacterium]MCI1919029.1 hypothetical protein [Enterococcaceae bacterium]